MDVWELAAGLLGGGASWGVESGATKLRHARLLHRK